MPITGKFYTSNELQELLGVSKQRVSNIAADHNWTAIVPGLYCAEDVELYLGGYREIDADALPVASHEYPEGITDADREADHAEIIRRMESEIDDDDTAT